jgi:PBP1b-binding outer membrane lipoprotein LpoB
MKSLIALLMLATTLAGCVAVPVYEPAPSYGYYYYPAPAPNVQFQYRYYRR